MAKLDFHWAARQSRQDFLVDNFATCKQIKLDDFPFHETTVNVTLTESHLWIIRFLNRNMYELIVYNNIVMLLSA